MKKIDSHTDCEIQEPKKWFFFLDKEKWEKIQSCQHDWKFVKQLSYKQGQGHSFTTEDLHKCEKCGGEKIKTHYQDDND